MLSRDSLGGTHRSYDFILFQKYFSLIIPSITSIIKISDIKLHMILLELSKRFYCLVFSCSLSRSYSISPDNNKKILVFKMLFRYLHLFSNLNKQSSKMEGMW